MKTKKLDPEEAAEALRNMDDNDRREFLRPAVTAAAAGMALIALPRSSSADPSYGVDMQFVIDPNLVQPILNQPLETPPAGRTLYAQTSVSIVLNDGVNRQKCIDALIQSDIELRKRPDSYKLWEWDVTHVVGNTVFFGVSWYDRSFFDSRKNAFLNTAHQGYYAAFGATAGNFTVRHALV